MEVCQRLNGIIWAMAYRFKALWWKILSTNTNLETLQKLSSYIRVFDKYVLKSLKNKSNLLNDWILVVSFSMEDLVSKCITIFLGKQGKRCNSPKIFCLRWSSLKICFEICKKPEWNHLSHGILVEGLIMPNLIDEYKTIFLEKQAKPWISPKSLFLYWSFL